MDLQYVFLEKNESAAPVEKPKFLDVKRKRIKKKKGNKNLLKKCLSPGKGPRRKFKNKGSKKFDLAATQESENAEKVELEPSLARPFEKEKKENLVLSPIDPCANVKKEDMVPSQEPTCDKLTEVPSLPEPVGGVDKTGRDGLLLPNLDEETGMIVNEHEATGPQKNTVKGLVDHDVFEPLLHSDTNGSDSSLMAAPAVNGLIHAPLDETDNAKGMETSVSNYHSDTCMNHISSDFESSALLHAGLLLESS